MKDVIRLDGYSVYEAEKFIREYINDMYEKCPIEPKLKSNTPTDVEVIEYFREKEIFNSNTVDCKKKTEFRNSESNRLYDLLIEKMREDSGLNTIPEKYRDKVYQYAYDQGHGAGYSEVYSYLCDLVNIFD